MQPIFHITQTSPYIDERVAIRLTNLQPLEHVTIHATMHDNVGTRWASWATFAADADGTIDVANAQPLAGTYNEADAMGLFWSMIPTEKTGVKTPLQPLHTILTLQRGDATIATATVTRAVTSRNVQRTVVRERGLVGTFLAMPTV